MDYGFPPDQALDRMAGSRFVLGLGKLFVSGQTVASSGFDTARAVSGGFGCLRREVLGSVDSVSVA
eukprot:12584897-Alexandrium_andersonii.AAC.1